ncbi:MAG: hypothetical protein HYU64_00310 [Armatimonadetes bacterium]|nr:hypothetical protein [Armatimonadota bacterium]
MVRNQDLSDSIDWGATTWEGSRRRQLECWATLSLDQILDAQEEMADLSGELASNPARTPPVL